MLLNPFIGTVGVGTGGGGGGAGITATDRGTGSNASAGTSLVIGPGSSMTAGNTGILVLAMDNASGATTNMTTTSYTDSVGNVWYLIRNGVGGSANNVAESAVFMSYLAFNFTTSDTLTLNFNTSTTAKAWTWIEASCAAGNYVMELRSAVITTANTGTPTTTCGVGLSNGDLILGFGAAESADTWVGTSDATNGSWSAQQSTSIGSGATGMSVISQTKVVNAFGAITFAPTLTAADCRIGYALFAEVEAKCRGLLMAQTTTDSANTVSFIKPIPAGSIGVICIAADNSVSGGGTQNLPASPADSKGNTWTLRQTGIYDPGAAAVGVEIGIYTSVIGTPLVRGDTITFTYTGASVNAKSLVIWEFAPQAAGTMSYVTGAIGTGAQSAAPSVTTGSITNGNYVIGMCGLEGDNTFVGDSDTTNGTWKQQATGGSDTGAAGMAITSQWKQVTSTATQTYDVTCTLGDTKIGWIEITET